MKLLLSRLNNYRTWIALTVAVVLLLSGSVIYALTLNNVTGSWSNAVGGSGTPTCLTTITVGTESQVRYGDDDFTAGCPASTNVQSGFGFDGSTTTSFTNGQPFVLGELTHYNNQIFASSLLQSVDLSLNVNLTDPLYNAALSTTVTLDETANNLSTCPYGGSQPCSDKVSISLQSTQFTVAGTNYQLEILGLIPGQMGSCAYNATTIKGSFISAENAANPACIFGRLTPIDDAELVITKDASVTQAHPGDIIDYQIDYNCFSTTTSCNAPVLVDYLPDEVIYTGSTGSTHTVGSSGIYSSGNNSVTFQFVDPLPAGSTGFVRIRVRVRDDGTVGDGQSISNLAVSTLGNGPTSTATHSLPAVVSSNWDVVKTAPPVVFLDTDRPTTDNTYSVGICSNGSDVNLLGAQMVDTLPANAVFVSASGSGVYDAGPPGTVTWNLGDLTAASGCTYETVTVRYPNPPFVTAQNVTNTVDGTGTIVGGIPWTDTASVTNPLQQLIPNPSVAMNKAPGRSGYIIGATAQFLLSPRNTGNVSLDGFTVTDTLPPQIDLTRITVGSFDNYAGAIIVRYERSDNPGVWNIWPGGPFPDDNRTLNVSALGLPGGVYITKVQWDYGTVIPGFTASGGGAGRIQLYGTVISPDHTGAPVTTGSVITNTATLDWHYTPGTGGPGTGGSSNGSASIDVDAIPIPVFDKSSAGGISAAWRFLIGQQVGYYVLSFNNNTGISVDNFTITDAIPAQFNVTSITIGSYNNFVGGTVAVRYQRSDNPGVWNVWPGSPFTPSNQTLAVSSLGLPGGVVITNLEWGYGTVVADFYPNAAPRVNGIVMNPDRNGSAVNNNSNMSNTARLSWDYQGVPSFTDDTQSDPVHTPEANPAVQKSTTSSGPYIPSSSVTYALRVGAASNSPSVLVNPIVMELLPTNLNYVAGSWVYNAGSSGVPAPAFEQIANYDGTGRTLLRWRFTGSFPQNQFATITFNTTISAGASQGSLTNDYYVTSNDIIVNGTVTDTNDLDGDGQRNDTLIGTSTTIPVDQLVGLDSFKGVRGELDSGYSVYPASGLTIPSGRVDYRLTIINRGNIPVNNVKVIDILPFVGDTGVQDTRQRNSAWRPVLTGPVAAPAGVTVYYSTSANPCRPQIIPSGPAGCTAPNWTLLPPADITTVYSLRFDFTTTLAPGQSFVFNWTMKAPPNAPDGTIAWNSFAYTSTNAVTGVPLRPAEPNKVGIRMSRPVVAPLIDLVKSTNGDDANLPTGPLIQVGDPVTWTYVITNTGNTRLANITLTDDVLGAITCAEGAIPPLDPAQSFTCTVTGTATINQYSNIGTVSGQPVDSSNVPLTDINGVTLSPVTDTDPSHYFGYNPALSSLGDYVWIDSDADGVQDVGEVGLGGVTVNLYEDGNPTAIATTFTDGTGFYTFPNLTADDYFVEFIIPSTYTFTPQDQGGDDTRDSDADTTTGRTAVTTLAVSEDDPTWDAGVLPPASIGDFVWRDNDGNNIQNGTESGVANVKVDLLNNVGAVIATTYTDPAGFYGFTDLTPGDYAVQFTLPTGYIFSLQDQGANDTVDSDVNVATGRTVTTTLSPGENDPTWDAGLVQVASIGDKVWRDNNNNGQQDSGEPGVSGVTVRLLDSTGTVLQTTTTDATGNYLFNNLRNGDYAIEFVLPAGFVFSTQDVGNNNSDSDANVTTGRTVNTTLTPGENDLTWDAGLVPLASIGNFVWNDANNNGQQDGGEAGFSGVTVNLLDSGGAVVSTTATNASGNYLFDNLRPGDYAIQMVKPAGYVFSPRDTGSDVTDSDANRTTGQMITTTLSPGENDLTWDAGLVQDASIGNYVWSDTNDNGLQDGGEPGVSGITVRLLDSSGNVVSTTTTDGTGFYLFDFLTPADYSLEFVAPANYSMARRDQGADDTVDSDPDRFTGRTITTTLSPGEDDLTWDAGLVLSATIGNYVWNDANQNGVQDGGESGVSGVTVHLLNSAGTTVLTTTTDASGNYLFDPVPPDDYRVEFILPSGYVFTLADQGGDDTTDSDANITTGRTILTTLSPDEDDMTWDSGLISVASIGDKVWRDNDNDGVQDAGEPGVSGVTVRLLDSGGAVVSTTTTNGSGIYSFTNLRPGDYAIEVVLPAGFQFSPQDAAAATDATDSDVNITTGRAITTTLSPGENDLTWDAGLVPLARIGNFVWRDNDNDGVQDAGEPGVQNVTVHLLDSTGTQIRSTTTNASGNYSFTNLPPGTYSVEFILPATYQFSPKDAAAPATDSNDSDADTTTGRTITTVLDPGETDNTWDAGLVPLVNIGDKVWQDTNGNGQQDGGEPAIPNVTVNLLNSGGTVIGTTTTDASGLYAFTNLPPGTYAVEFILPSGYIFTARDQGVDATDSDPDRTTGRTINVTLSPGTTDNSWDAGMVLPASLGNYVWYDADDNGVQDGGESGVPNITVRLLNTSFTVLATTTTDASGNYLFSNLIPGSYIVEFVAPSGYVIARLDQGGNDATDSDANRASGRTITKALAMGENDLTWDAGLVQVASIGDRVWRDNNNNGVQDSGEPGLSGVTVQLRDNAGTLVTSMLTDTNGNYLFSNLTPADYSIQVVLPSGYQFSPIDQGADDGFDSDVNTGTGRTVNTTLSSGENDMTWDAGLVPLASIGDRVWVDINNNGVQDSGEVGLANVTVRLLNSGGTTLATVLTNASGNYSFTNLAPADYSIQVVLPAGYQFSPQDAGGDDTTDSDVDTTTGRTINTTLDPAENDMTWDAGVVPLTSIGDRVWIDANDNGIQDVGENGLSGVTVHLLNSGGTVINTATTDASGNYAFTNLSPGTYAIEFVTPAGYVISQRDQGADDTKDSDADLTTGRTINTTLDPSEVDMTWDMGLVPAASIGDYVWNDINGNGQQDGGESGVPGVTVHLLDSVGTVLQTATTNGTGGYSFTTLRPGTYAIEFVLPGGYIYTTRDTGADTTDSDPDRTTGRTINTVLSPGENDPTWDAGVVQPASIGDYVWLDANDTGVQDGGESGVANVTVRLLDSTGTVLQTTTTDGSGNYLFNNLIPATYAVEFVAPSGYVIARLDQGGNDATDSDADRTTGRAINTALSAGENDLTWDAGLVQVASIGDRVWVDINNNGIQDTGESGQSGVIVNLLNSSGTQIATTTTDASGNYLFNNLTPDDYAIEVVLPTGFQFSTIDQGADDGFDSDVNTVSGRTVNTTLGSNENDLTWDAGLVPLASIGDRVWIDINNNGRQDGGENGLSGVTVRLLNSTGTVIQTTTTDASGNYQFTLLPPADYAIQVVLPAGYEFSQRDAAIATDSTDSDVDTTTGRTINTTLDPGENDPTWDAGVVPLTSIGDRVWIDINDNGVQDGGEVGLANVTVRLLNSTGAVVNTTTTDASGNYLFSNVAPADYSIEFVTPAGYVIAKLDQGGDDATDSDANLTTGRTISTTLDPAENDLTWDMGLVPVASVGDFVWIDINNNGVQDGGELGLSGVTVRLLDSAGTVLNTKTTDASGGYLFDNLRPGVYAIQVVLPAGYQFSPQDAAIATDATDSDADITTGRMINTILAPAENDLTWDAGVVPLVSIGDRVWVDMDNDGVQDAGENGLSGVTVRLLDSGGTTIATATTDASGNYSFTLLPPGTYAIQVVLPTGYQFSPQDAVAATDATDSDVNTTTGRTVNTTLTPSQNDMTWDAGVVPLTSIGDRVWRDNDGDGVQDAGEPGVSGVTVRLLDSGGAVIATRTTDASGNYLFSSLPPGDYSIQVVRPTGYIFSPQDAAAATDATDSDVNTTTGRTITTTLIPDEDDMTWDAGLIPLGSLGDTVWIDLDGDALVDAGETGISGVTVNLLDSLGNVIATTTTDANGNYLFDNLIAGTYTVRIDTTTLPPLYGIAYDPDGTPDHQTTYNLGIGEHVNTLDFGYWPLGSIGDTVWLDSNRNGTQDPLEVGLAGVTVNLLDSLGNIIATDVTDANGNYLFENLPPGTYTVEVDITTLPPGLIQYGDPDGVLDSESTVTIAPGENLLTVDFGYAPPLPPVPVGGPTVTPTIQPTPEVTGDGGTSQPWVPVTACERKCVDWQLYHTNETGDWEIFRLGNLSDRPAVSPNLSQGEGADDIAPTRSPNAEWIVFSSNRDGNWELYVAPTDGDSSKTRRITHNTVAIDTDPVWGPNNYVVYETTRDGNWELYLIDMVTGVETRLTDNAADDINAFWSPDGTKILFQSDRTGTWQIYEIDLRTGSITRLSDGSADDVDPQYSNAGDRIVFRSYRDGEGKNSVIYTMDADGRNVARVSDVAGDATSQSWSPDDNLIAYQSNLDGDLDIYVYDLSTGKTRQVTNNDVPDYAPTWLCGTTQVIFTSDVTGNPDLFNAEALPIDAPAVKVDADATQLTFDPADDIYPENSPTEENASREGHLPGFEQTLGEQTDFLKPDFTVTEPDVSIETPEAWESINSCETVCPSWTLFHSDRTGDGEIFRLDDNASDASSQDISLGAGGNDFGPTRAPNAQWIAFTSDRDGNNEIYITASDGSAQYRATNNPANDTDPAWSPDSQRIVFESDRDGNWNLYMVDVQTGVETRITDDPADDRNASWSSAGGKIAFESDRSGTWQIYTYDLATREIAQLTSSDEPARSPVFGNGGSLIAFAQETADRHSVIKVMQQDGTNVQDISDPKGSARNPAWYFDDTLLAYQSDLDGDLDIYVYDFATSQTRKLTNNGVDDYAPTWQCGKPAVTFTSDVTGNPDLFRADALPIDASAVDVQTDADQLTQSTASDRDPVGAPTEENASREAE